MCRQLQKLRSLDSVAYTALALLIVLCSGMVCVVITYSVKHINGLTSSITELQTKQKRFVKMPRTTMLPLTKTNEETTSQKMEPVTPQGCVGRLVKGILVYSVAGGLVNGRVININGRTTANPYRFSLNLWSKDKRMVVMHFAIRFDQDILISNTMRSANASAFPAPAGKWGKEVDVMRYNPIKAMASFQAKIYAENSTELLVLIGLRKNYVRNRLGVALRDIIWFTVETVSGENPQLKELCVW